MKSHKIVENCQQAQYLVFLLKKHQSFIRIIHLISLSMVNCQIDSEELDEADAEMIT